MGKSSYFEILIFENDKLKLINFNHQLGLHRDVLNIEHNIKTAEMTN